MLRIKKKKKAHHKVVLSESFYADIDWWLQFLPVFNGKRLVLNQGLCLILTGDIVGGEILRTA